MTCDPIRDLLPLYAGGELEENERVAAEAHLALCPACSRELDRYREDRAGLAALREVEAPAGTWEAIQAAVLPPKKPFRLLDRILPYAALLMVGLAGGLVLHRAYRAPAPAESPALIGGRASYGPGARPVTASEAAGPRGFLLPRVNTDGGFYLPRVEALPASGEKDY